MTRLFSILMSLAFLGTMSYNMVQVGDFVLNQDEIAELFCINKDKPELKCNGKCHLAKKVVSTPIQSAPDKEMNVIPSLTFLLVFTTEVAEDIQLFTEEEALITSKKHGLLFRYSRPNNPPPEFSA